MDEVVLYVNQTDDTDTVVKSYTDTSVVELTLDESVVISCRCVGGHPAPILKVFHVNKAPSKSLYFSDFFKPRFLLLSIMSILPLLLNQHANSQFLFSNNYLI